MTKKLLLMGLMMILAMALATPALAQETAPTVKVGHSDELGDFLVGSNDMTLYIFLKDEPGKSNCYDACAQNWPPLLVDADPVAGPGVDASLLGTTTRDDGSTQVTYNGHPLYFWVKDSAPGDTTGQGVKDVWFVISPSGSPVTPAGMGGPPDTLPVTGASQVETGSNSTLLWGMLAAFLILAVLGVGAMRRRGSHG